MYVSGDLLIMIPFLIGAFIMAWRLNGRLKQWSYTKPKALTITAFTMCVLGFVAFSALKPFMLFWAPDWVRAVAWLAPLSFLAFLVHWALGFYNAHFRKSQSRSGSHTPNQPGS